MLVYQSFQFNAFVIYVKYVMRSRKCVIMLHCSVLNGGKVIGIAVE